MQTWFWTLKTETWQHHWLGKHLTRRDRKATISVVPSPASKSEESKERDETTDGWSLQQQALRGELSPRFFWGELTRCLSPLLLRGELTRCRPQPAAATVWPLSAVNDRA